ncbi:unnamed protein product, partial [marine sediment metagenome]
HMFIYEFSRYSGYLLGRKHNIIPKFIKRSNRQKYSERYEND